MNQKRHKDVTPCKWYRTCPIRRYTEQGRIESKWVERYCLVGNPDCVRYQMEAAGAFHLDHMLPNGELRQELEIQK